MSTDIAEQSPVLTKALRYTVDENGRVDTQGVYRTITEQQWNSARETCRGGNARYTQLMNGLAKGTIFGVPVKDSRAAWNCRRTLKANAKRHGFDVAYKTVHDPERETGLLVLVRRAETDDE